MKKLEILFKDIIQKYTTNEAIINSMWLNIETNYRGRPYHNLYHIKAMVTQLTDIKKLITNFDETILAVFYHDIIYVIPSIFNEIKSAMYAKDELGKINYPNVIGVQQKISATTKHLKTNNQDTNYLLDADLSMLGTESFIYANTIDLIKTEYKKINHFVWVKGRKSFLTKFLKKDRLFITDYFYDKYEKQARVNMQTELNNLNG